MDCRLNAPSRAYIVLVANGDGKSSLANNDDRIDVSQFR